MDDDRWPQRVPVPRTGTPTLPGTRRAWVQALGQVSGLLLALRTEEADGATPPDPLADGLALRAWSRLTGPVLRDPDHLTVPEVDIVDLAVVGATARVLGTSLCRWRAGAPADVVAAVLRREAAVHDRDPEHLVAQVARVHGVLSASDDASDDASGAASGALVWHALDDGDARPAEPDAGQRSGSGSGPSTGSSWPEPSTAPGTSPPGSISGS